MKCSWNFGSIAVSIFSILRTTPSISARAAAIGTIAQAIPEQIVIVGAGAVRRGERPLRLLFPDCRGGLLHGEGEMGEWRAGKLFHSLVDDVHLALLARQLRCRREAHRPPFVVRQGPCPQ